MPDLHSLSAHELSAGFASGSFSPVDVTDAVLARIEACEPTLNAMYVVHADAARERARAAEQRWRDGSPLSALDGVPITLKENLATKGDCAPIGTLANAELPPADADSPVAARVREYGLVLLGKTTMPDFGMLSSGISSIHGTTRNPWRLDRNPSGSSSGAGAAAAACYGPLHVGTDIGGSVRLPATHCGLFGLKPSLGRVPICPPYTGRVAGPMTRSVRDAAMLMNVITGHDARDYMNLPRDDVNYASALASVEADSLRGVRIGFMPSMGAGLGVHDEVAAASADAAAALEGAGAEVEEIESFFSPELLDGLQVFFEARSNLELRGLPNARREQVLPFIQRWCTHRADGFKGAEVMASYQVLMAVREAAVAACEPFDFLLSPVSPILPFEVDLACPGNDPENALPHVSFTMPYNISEQPAASVNWTFSEDALPIGVQVVGKRFDDVGVMAMAAHLERLRPAQRAYPDTFAADE